MAAPLTYSWIALAASAPVILLLTTWTLAVFHCRRRQWSPMDVFLVSILSQSIIQQFLGFTYSILTVIKLTPSSTGDTVCTGMLWFFMSIPIFKGATIVSLAIDRWLFATKFDYRLCIRKNHVRYHMAVLAVLSSIVGFTALLTFNDVSMLRDDGWTETDMGTTTYSFDQCTFLPFKFDLKFVLFYIGTHGILILMGLIALWKNACGRKVKHKNNSGGNGFQLDLHQHQQQLYEGMFGGGQPGNGGRGVLGRKRPRIFNHGRSNNTESMDLTPTMSTTSTTSSNVSAENPFVLFSTPGLKAKAVLSNGSPEMQTEEYFKFNNSYGGTNESSQTSGYEVHDKRLATVTAILLLSLLCTHLPLLGATLLSWFKMTSTFDYTSIIPIHWPLTNVILWAQVTEGLVILLILLTVDPIIPSWMFQRQKKKSKKLIGGGFLQHHLNSRPLDITGAPKLDNPSGSPAINHLNNSTMVLRSGPTHHYFPPPPHRPVASPFEIKNNRFPMPNGSLFATLTAAAASAANKGAGNGHSQADSANNVYMSLNNDYDSFESFERTLRGDETEEDKKSYHARCASVTTVANDDFEFHQMLPPRNQGERVQPIYNYSGNNTKPVVAKRSKTPDELLMNPPCPKVRQSKRPFEPKPKPRENNYHGIQVAIPPPSPFKQQSCTSPQQLTSLSMNDLDLLDEMEPKPESFMGQPSPSMLRAAEYKHQRIYRKRPRLQTSIVTNQQYSSRPQNCRGLKNANVIKPISRRVMSLECLAAPNLMNQQTDPNYRQYFDVSYLDTGDLCLVRQGDKNRCIFVTDFI